MPAVSTVNAKPVASTVPLAVSAIGPELAAGLPVQVPLRNQSMLTLPLGNGLLASPVTVTKSWTVVPAATVVTTGGPRCGCR